MVEFVSTEHTPRNLLIRAVRMEPGPAGSGRSRSKGSSGDEEEQEGSAGGAVDGTGSGGSRGRQGRRAANAAAGTGAAVGDAGGGRGGGSWDRGALRAAEEYVRLRDYWGVVPQLQVGAWALGVGGAGHVSHGFNPWASHLDTD